MRSALSDFTTGFLAPWRGLALIHQNRRICRLAALPFFFSVAILFMGFGWMIPNLSSWLPDLAARGVAVLGLAEGFVSLALYWLILILAWPISLFGLFYFLILLARILMTPLMSLLAERTLIEIKVIQEQPFRLWPWISLNIRLLRTSLMKAVLFAFLGAALFLLSFIPFFGFVTAFGFLVIAAFDMVDASFEALQMRLRDRIQFFRENSAAFFGFASALGLVFLVPGLNFFFLPISVVGGCDLVRRLIKG